MQLPSASAALQLPVRFHGIQLGRPIDLLVETESWSVLGFVVRCGDEAIRFLPFGAAQLGKGEIVVGSALMLLDDVAFYDARGTSYRSLLGGAVAHGGRRAGVLRDLVLSRARVEELEVARGGAVLRVPAVGSEVVPSRASAA